MKKVVTYFLLLFTVFKAYPQTEFYLSTREQLNTGCQRVVEEQPYGCEIPCDFRVNAIMWNSDSIEWCTTKEGRSRAHGYMQGIMWQYDGMASDRMWTDHDFLVLDTLTHAVTATIPDYPEASFTFKGINSNYRITVCSKNMQMFETDSVKMTVESTNPAVYSKEDSIPLIENITVDDSNKAIINITYENELIRIDTLLNKVDSENEEIIAYPFRARKTYSPKFNSYSVHVPLSFHKYASQDYLTQNPPGCNMLIIDTIGIVMSKGDKRDTLQLQFKRLFYGDSSRSSGIIRRARSHSKREDVLEVYDLKGRIVKNKRLSGKVKTDLSNGVYIYQAKGVDGILHTKKYYYNQNAF